MLFILLLFLSILNGIFGSFIVWNNIVNYFDNFSHSAIFSVVIGHVFNLNEFYTLIIFSILFSLSLCIFIFMKVKLNNNLLIIVGSTFIGLASLLNKTCNHIHSHSNDTHDHNHFENGMLNLFLGNKLDELNQINLTQYIILAILLIAIGFSLKKEWLKIILNNQIAPMTKKDYLIHFIFLISVGLFSILTIKINGVLLAIGTSILPIFIVKFFAKNPNHTISYSIIFNIFITLFGFIVSNLYDLNYSGFIILFEVTIFSFLSLKNNLFYKHL